MRQARNWKMALTGAHPRKVMYEVTARGWIVVTITLCQVTISSTNPTARPAQAMLSIWTPSMERAPMSFRRQTHAALRMRERKWQLQIRARLQVVAIALA